MKAIKQKTKKARRAITEKAAVARVHAQTAAYATGRVICRGAEHTLKGVGILATLGAVYPEQAANHLQMMENLGAPERAKRKIQAAKKRLETAVAAEALAIARAEAASTLVDAKKAARARRAAEKEVAAAEMATA